MSIWGSTVAFDADDHAEDCSKWAPCDEDDERGTMLLIGGTAFRLDHDAPCSCRCGPIAYQGSHVLPSENDPRAGMLDLAEIPSFVTRDGRDDQPEDGKPWPWLRVGVSDGGDQCVDVLLDVKQVAKLQLGLASWLARVGGTDADDVVARLDTLLRETCGRCQDCAERLEHREDAAEFIARLLDESVP